MKLKIYILAVLFLFPQLVLASTWKTQTVLTVLDNSQFLLENRATIQLIGLKIPDLFFPNKHSQCFNKRIYQTHKTLLEGQKVKIKKESPNSNQVYLKFNKTKSFALFLLSQGWAQTTDYEHKLQKTYKAAEKEAQKKRLGLWGSCQPYKDVRQSLFEKGTLFFNPQYRSFLAPISTGWVTEVLDGTTIKLSNGLKIKLLGLDIPSLNDPRKTYQCFAQESKTFLNNLLLGRKVFLSRDQSQIFKINTLARYVHIPETSNRNGLFINQYLIQQGFARHKPRYPDLKYQALLSQTQKKTFKNPKGAWVTCLKEISHK